MLIKSLVMRRQLLEYLRHQGTVFELLSMAKYLVSEGLASDTAGAVTTLRRDLFQLCMNRRVEIWSFQGATLFRAFS